MISWNLQKTDLPHCCTIEPMVSSIGAGMNWLFRGDQCRGKGRQSTVKVVPSHPTRAVPCLVEEANNKSEQRQKHDSSCDRVPKNGKVNATNPLKLTSR